MNDDERLVSHVHPPDWQNPHPAAVYDLVVLGGGTAGLVSAVGAASLGARVALVERALLGGDCLNTGCVPSKTLLRAARAVHDARAASAVGVQMTPAVDFAAVMTAVRARRADLAPHDSAARLTSLGVDVYFGNASFTDSRSVTVEGRRLVFRRAVIATGGRPAIPVVEGLAGVTYLTSDTLFSMTHQPRTMVVIGGGPIGCEMAQAFALLGTHVTLVEAGPRLLPRDDPDAAAIIERRLTADGVTVLTGAGPTGKTAPDLTSADAVLVAAGRTPRLDVLNLDAAGVAFSADGLRVDEWLRTSNRRIYAAGDVCSSFKFTHAADAMARIVIQNALFPARRRVSALVIPWATYTFPEVAHVGLSPADAARGGAEPITVPLTEVDRAVIDGQTDGFLRVHHRRGRIVAATIVAAHAGELIGYVASLMRRGGTVEELSTEIFPYPTLAEALRKAGDTSRRATLTPRVTAGLRWYFAIRRFFPWVS